MLISEKLFSQTPAGQPETREAEKRLGLFNNNSDATNPQNQSTVPPWFSAISLGLNTIGSIQKSNRQIDLSTGTSSPGAVKQTFGDINNLSGNADCNATEGSVAAESSHPSSASRISCQSFPDIKQQSCYKSLQGNQRETLSKLIKEFGNLHPLSVCKALAAMNKGDVRNKDQLVIADFTITKNEKRLFILDLNKPSIKLSHMPDDPRIHSGLFVTGFKKIGTNAKTGLPDKFGTVENGGFGMVGIEAKTKSVDSGIFLLHPGAPGSANSNMETRGCTIYDSRMIPDFQALKVGTLVYNFKSEECR